MMKMNDELLELVADFFHMNWSHWMKYQFSKMWEDDPDPYPSRGMMMDQDDVSRWKRQMNTPYSELSEKEKDSDREWAKKLMDLLNDATS